MSEETTTPDMPQLLSFFNAYTASGQEFEDALKAHDFSTPDPEGYPGFNIWAHMMLHFTGACRETLWDEVERWTAIRSMFGDDLQPILDANDGHLPDIKVKVFDLSQILGDSIVDQLADD